MDVLLRDEQDDPLPTEPLVALARAAMRAERLPVDSELAITLVDVETMAGYNREYLDREGPTDVLALPIEDLSEGIEMRVGVGPPLLLGDIIICPRVVAGNASAAGVAFDDEMALMVVHGFLHLLGHDHMIAAEAEAMEKREREILALVGRERP
jgi:probable rRNA maturation factor